MAQSLRTQMKEKYGVTDPFFDIKVEGIKTLETGKPIDKKAVIHAASGDVISVVNPDWNIISNKELINKFEKSLQNDNIEFARTAAGVSPNLTKFWANYRFPDVQLKLAKPYQTQFGKLDDAIELSIDIWGGYAAGISTGFMIGGFRKICANGLVRKESLYEGRWAHNRIDANELLKTFSGEVNNAAKLFQSNMIQGWNQLADQKYDRDLVKPVMMMLYKQLEDSKTYRESLRLVHMEHRLNKKLETMWNFYNMLTWFFTHVIEKSSRQRAMKLSNMVGNELMGAVA